MSSNQKVSVILFKEKKIIVLALIFSIIMAGIVTFLIPKQYSSFAIMYPAKTNSLSEVTSNPDFGYDIHADRLIQLIESQILRDSITEYFSLIDYYELNESQPDWSYKLSEFMARDIKINRTRFLSVVITVTTKDPELSANIANYITTTVDVVKENILKENTIMAYDIYKGQYITQNSKVDSLVNIIFQLADNKRSTNGNALFNKRNKIIEEQQNNNYATAADEAIMGISGKNQNQVTEKLINNYYREKDILYNIHKKYRAVEEELNYPMPKSYIISEAKPDYKKVSPSLSRNILIAIGIGLLSSIMFILIKHKLKSIKEEAQ